MQRAIRAEDGFPQRAAVMPFKKKMEQGSNVSWRLPELEQRTNGPDRRYNPRFSRNFRITN